MRSTTPAPPQRSDSLTIAEIARRSLAPNVKFSSSALSDTPRDWFDVLRAMRRHRLEGLVSPQLRDFSAPGEVVERAQTIHRASASRALKVAHETALVSKILSDADIDHLICKGVPFALIAEKDMTIRGAGDIDVWVRPSDVARSELALGDHGWSRRGDAAGFPRPEDGFRWRYFLNEMIELTLSHKTSVDVDLHWKLYRFAVEFSFDFDSALLAASSVQIGGVSVPTLSAKHALEHLAQHARKEAWPYLRSVVDIAWVCDVIDDSEVSRIAADNRNVRLAVGLAANLSPRLTGLVDLNRADRRIVSEAWERCLKADSWAIMGRRSSGWDGSRRAIDLLWWMWRSSPSWRVRRSQIRIWLQRSRSLIDPRRRPWIDQTNTANASND